MEKLFAYGTLLDDEIQQIMFDRILKTLPGFRLNGYEVKTDGRYLSAIASENPFSYITGSLLLIDEYMWPIIDFWEGENYERKTIKVLSKTGVSESANIYLAKINIKLFQVVAGKKFILPRERVLEDVRASVKDYYENR